MIINWRKVMEEDLFEKILKELLNGKSLRELQEKYHFDRKRFKERIDREYPIGTHQREQVENQLRENKKNKRRLRFHEKDHRTVADCCHAGRFGCMCIQDHGHSQGRNHHGIHRNCKDGRNCN